MFRYVTPNRPTHDDVPPLDQPAPTQTAAISTKTERLAVEATRSSLNYHPGCIKVVDTFRSVLADALMRGLDPRIQATGTVSCVGLGGRIDSGHDE